MAKSTKSVIVSSTALTASEHDAWFREEIEKTIEGLRNGSVALIPEDEHDRRWQEKRAELLAASRKSK
jgi:hypothetical protein